MRLQCDGWAHQMFFVYASDDARLVFDLYSVYRKSDMACGCCDTSKLQWNSKSITVFVYLFIRIFFLSLLVNQKIVYSWPFDSFGSFNWFIFTNTVTFLSSLVWLIHIPIIFSDQRGLWSYLFCLSGLQLSALKEGPQCSGLMVDFIWGWKWLWQQRNAPLQMKAALHYFYTWILINTEGLISAFMTLIMLKFDFDRCAHNKRFTIRYR